jgi:hypothetical protein
MSRSRDKGTAWETLIVHYLRTEGVAHAERRALGGNRDRGDVAGLPGVVIEAKDCQRIELAQWLDEAAAEKRNDGADLGVVWAKRRGRWRAEQGYILMDPREWVQLMREAGRIPEVSQ